MSEPDNEKERLRAISRRVGTGETRRAPRVIAAGVVALLLAGAALLAFAPNPLRSLLGFGTSKVEEIQQPDPMGMAGVSTAIPPRARGADIRPVNTALPRPERPSGTMTPSDQARLAALEEELRALRSRETGIDRAELQSMLDANAAQVRAEMNRMLLSQQPVMSAGINSNTDADARKRMEEERARRAAIEEAQIKSRGLVLDGAGATVPGGGAPGDGRRASGNESFLASAGAAGHETVRATQLADPSRMIVQGTILEGVLETAMSTALPGAVRAVLSEDVLSYDGTNVLLPRGTRLIGTYSADVKIAQRRALVAWNRAITPDGTSVALGGVGADALGRSGQTGHVDTHFLERFGSAALISLFGIAPQLLISENTNGDAADAIEDLGDDLSSATSGALDAYLRIPPTITVDQGDRLTIFVNRDLMF
jgi:type IV secretion system protein VirB10